MPLKKIQVKTGMNRENTNYAGEGGYWSGDKIRFRSGYAEKIGGWITNSLNSFAGVCRSLFEWVTLSSEALIAVGTNQRYYVQNNGTFYPITPVSRTVTLGASPFTAVSGSNLVTVTDAGFASTAGSFVTFSGSTGFLTLTVTGTSGDGTAATITFAPQAVAPTVGDSVTIAGVTPAGYNGVKTITASTTSSLSFLSGTTGPMTVAGTVTNLRLNGSYEIVTAGSGTYTVYVPGVGGSSSGGGSAVVATYDLVASSATYSATASAGWGVSAWGSGAWGTSTGGSTPLALWSQSNWGENLLFGARGGKIYYWVKDTTTYAPAVTMLAYANSVPKTYKTVQANVTGSTTFVVSDTLDIDYGAVVSVKSGGGTIPAGTYVLYSTLGGWNGSTTITVSAAVTLTTASVVNFSFAGNTSPTQINQIVSFSTYQFAVALGSSPYDPSNPTPAFNPMLVRWSDQSVVQEWTPSTFNQSGEVILANGSYIVGGTAARQELLIWTDKALYSMQYIGAPYVFNFQTLMDNISIMSPNAMITVNNITYWMGVDKFYVYSGTVSPLPCTIRQYIFNNLNFSQSYQVICGHNEEYSEVWWHYPSTNSNTNDSYVIWNYADNNWYFGTMNRTGWYDTPLSSTPYGVISVQNSYLSAAISATDTQIPMITSASYPNSGVVIIDNEQIAYTTNGGTFLSGLTRGYNSTTAASHTIYAAVTNSPGNQIVKHEIGYDDGSVTPSVALPAYIETSDFDLDDGEHLSFVSRIVPDLTFDGSTPGSNPQVLLTLKPRYYPGSNYDSSTPSTVNSIVLPPTPPAQIPVEQYTGVLYARVRGRQMAFRVESTKKGTTWQLGLMRFDIRPDGRR
jgi:hypothetical protein